MTPFCRVYVKYDMRLYADARDYMHTLDLQEEVVQVEAASTALTNL